MGKNDKSCKEIPLKHLLDAYNLDFWNKNKTVLQQRIHEGSLSAFTSSKLTIETLEQRCETCSKLTIKTPIEHVIAGWDLAEFILKKNSFT